MQENERYCNIVRDRIFTENEEKERKREMEENKNLKNSKINLEYHKIVNTQDGHTKFTIELQNLIDFVKERSYYRDLKGNRITPNGKLAPTPYQKLEKMNQDIKNYYENKLTKKSTTLLVENSRKRKLLLNPNFNIINTINNSSRNRSKNSYSSKRFSKSKEKTTFSKVLSIPKEIKNKCIQNNISLITNNNVIELIPPNEPTLESLTNYSNSNQVCLTENYKNLKSRRLPNCKFKQINFWKEKLLYRKMNENNDMVNLSQNNTKNSQYMTEYIKKNKEKLNNLLLRINKNDLNNILNKNKNLTSNCKSKTRDFSSEINKYDLAKLNMDHLFKQDKNFNKYELNTLNTRTTKDNFTNTKKSENKFNTISMEMNHTKSFKINKNLALKNKDLKNNRYDNINKYRTINNNDFKKFKSIDIHKFSMKSYY